MEARPSKVNMNRGICIYQVGGIPSKVQMVKLEKAYYKPSEDIDFVH